VGLSVGSVEEHKRWLKEIDDIFHCKVNFPIIADEDQKVANLYGMIHQNAASTTVRPLLIISPDKKLKAWFNYPIFCGRNFHEVLRTLDALQLSEKVGVFTPPGWQPGEDVIIPDTLTDEEAKAKFPTGWKTITSYYRVTPQPK
jgi:alkyl hydroperoxide reductase subunit AhpC